LLGGAANALIFRAGEVEDACGDQKKPRYFALDPEKTARDERGAVLTFDYQSDKTREITTETLYQQLTERGQDFSLESLAYHLNRFQTLRKVDFFIHRRLGAFLHEQLDHFVKQEIVRLEEPYTLKRALAARESGAVVVDLLTSWKTCKRSSGRATNWLTTSATSSASTASPNWLEANGCKLTCRRSSKSSAASKHVVAAWSRTKLSRVSSLSCSGGSWSAVSLSSSRASKNTKPVSPSPNNTFCANSLTNMASNLPPLPPNQGRFLGREQVGASASLCGLSWCHAGQARFFAP